MERQLFCNVRVLAIQQPLRQRASKPSSRCQVWGAIFLTIRRSMAEETTIHLLQEAAATGGLPEEQTLGKAVSSQATDGIFDIHVYPVCASTQTVLTTSVACMAFLRSKLCRMILMPRINHAYLIDPENHDLAVLRDGLVMAEAMLNSHH